jgi:hypothetical protein
MQLAAVVTAFALKKTSSKATFKCYNVVLERNEYIRGILKGGISEDVHFLFSSADFFGEPLLPSFQY